MFDGGRVVDLIGCMIERIEYEMNNTTYNIARSTGG